MDTVRWYAVRWYAVRWYAVRWYSTLVLHIPTFVSVIKLQKYVNIMKKYYEKAYI